MVFACFPKSHLKESQNTMFLSMRRGESQLATFAMFSGAKTVRDRCSGCENLYLEPKLRPSSDHLSWQKTTTLSGRRFPSCDARNFGNRQGRDLDTRLPNRRCLGLRSEAFGLWNSASAGVFAPAESIPHSFSA